MHNSKYSHSIILPLRHARYRSLWLANLVSNLGTWMQAFAVTWLVASTSASALTTTLVQAVSWAPMMLFSLPAGVLADTVHQARLLFVINIIKALTASTMAVLAHTGSASITGFLCLTFVMASANAFFLPAWQASMSTLVEPGEIEAAATLNNLSFNLAALAGPCLGAAFIKSTEISWLFLLNALSFLGLLFVYWRWLSTDAEPAAHPRAAMHAGALAEVFTSGLKLAFHQPSYRQLLCLVALIFFASNAFPSLLPLLVRDVLHQDASTFALLMACLGAGAVLGAFCLPLLRRRYEKMHILSAALLVYALMLADLVLFKVEDALLLVPFIILGGVAWAAMISTVNGLAQQAFPVEARARTLSVYILVAAASQTMGSLTWGWLTEVMGLRLAFSMAALLLLAGATGLSLTSNFLEQQ